MVMFFSGMESEWVGVGYHGDIQLIIISLFCV